jgi:beta-lactamase superfamily II metal-dependent hydrolase
MISVGFENSYGHPHPDILTRLHERGIEVLRTDTLGLISVRTDGHRVRITTDHWSPGGSPDSAYSLSPSAISAPD